MFFKREADRFLPANYSILGFLLSYFLAASAAAEGASSAVSEYEAVTTAAKPEASPGLLNQWLFDQNQAFSAWDFGGQARVRYEIKQNAGPFPDNDFVEGQPNDNYYLLLREKIHIGYTPASWITVYAEGRDSSTTGDVRDPNPEADAFDLQQAYLTLGDLKEFPMKVTVGRQELSYGDERFFGISDWNNIGRVFDAARLQLVAGKLSVDAFAGRVVVPRDHHFNVVNNYNWFWGIYASSPKVVGWQTTDLYFIGHNVGAGSLTAIAPGYGGPPPRDVYTLGARVRSTPGKLHGWDYSAELAGQLGSINSGGVRLEHEALTADATVGYTWEKVATSPRLGLGYTYGSGDGNPNDHRNGTFDLLAGTNHRFFGLMDLWGMRNISSPRLMASLKPARDLSLALEYHVVWQAERADFFFPETAPGRDANGYGRNPQFDSFVGSELDVVATWVRGKFAEVQVGYGHFFVGDYIRQSVGSVSSNGGAVDANWFYAQAKFTF